MAPHVDNTAHRSEDQFRYRAFISYSHADRAWAEWLHRALERYRVPRRLVGTPGRDGPVPRRLYPVFRDADELPTSSDLGGALRTALAESRCLIVICSPASARSIWVNEEVLEFKRLGRADRILCLIVDGEPNADSKWAAGVEDGAPRECFCPALRFHLGEDGALGERRAEPIAADVRAGAEGRGRAKLRLIAGVVGIDFASLVRREARRVRQRWAAATAAILIAATAAGAAWWQLARERAETARIEALRNKSLRHTATAESLFRDGHLYRALGEALAALPRNLAKPDRPLVREALMTLYRIQLSSGLRHTVPAFAAAESHLRPTFVQHIAVSGDGRHIAALVSASNEVRVWERRAGAPPRLVLRITLLGNDALGVTALRFGPECGGRLLAFGTEPGNVQVWNVATKKRRSSFRAHADIVRLLAFADGCDSALLTSTGGDVIRYWNHATGALDRIVSIDQELLDLWPGTAGYTPTVGHALDEDGVFYRWNVDTNKLARKVKLKFDNISPDPDLGSEWTVLDEEASKLLVLPALSRTAYLFDGRSGKLIQRFAHASEPIRFARVVDARRGIILTATLSGDVWLWHEKSGRVLERLRLPVVDNKAGAFSGLAVTLEGAPKIITGSYPGVLQVWSLQGAFARLLGREDLADHGAPVDFGAFTGNDARVLTRALNGRTYIWDGTTGERYVDLAGIAATAVSRDGARMLIAYARDGRIDVLYGKTGTYGNMETGEVLPLLCCHAGVTTADFSTVDSSLLATGARGGTVLIWRTGRDQKRHEARRLRRSHLRPVFRLTGHTRAITRVRFSPDGRSVASASRDGTVRLWDAATGKLNRVFKDIKSAALDVRFDRTGARLVTAHDGGAVGLWDAGTGRLLRRLHGPVRQIYRAAFLPGGARVAGASHDHRVTVWDAESGDTLRVLRDHKGPVYGLSMGPKGERLCTASHDGTVILWDARTMERLATLRHNTPVGDCRFNGAGDRLITVAADGRARLWRIGRPDQSTVDWARRTVEAMK